MHTCEALIAAYEATEDHQFLSRAIALADQMCNRLSAQTEGLIWEHYDQDWQID